MFRDVYQRSCDRVVQSRTRKESIHGHCYAPVLTSALPYLFFYFVFFVVVVVVLVVLCIKTRNYQKIGQV